MGNGVTADSGTADKPAKPKKVIFAVPTVTKPYQVCLDSLAASIPLITSAGWDEGMANSIGCPYISRARSTMVTKALNAQADVVVFIDHDLSWEPEALLRLIETEGDVVAGTYRFKHEPEEYMGSLMAGPEQRPIVREDGCIKAHFVPAGFLKVTRNCINQFMLHYPELMYVEDGSITVDLFNHGVHNHVWYGEDYSFSRRWNECGGSIWIVPDIELHHHAADGRVFKGNFHKFLLRQPGGSDDPARTS